jgi:hypothetical protein
MVGHSGRNRHVLSRVQWSVQELDAVTSQNFMIQLNYIAMQETMPPITKTSVLPSQRCVADLPKNP